jgi:histidinol-phosphate phosphatase family protein
MLRRVGGFDERFPRAYREDADLALRVLGRGCWIETGRRITVHPLGSDQSRTAIRRQAGNRDDVLMWALHGGQWRARAGAPRGRLRRHLATTVLAALAPAALAAGRPAMVGLAAAGWTASTAEFAWARIAPGPRTRREVAAMVVTSAVIPPVAVAHAAVGVARLPRNLRSRPTTVLFDRDGTLIVNVPYNGDPAQVRPMPRAGRALLRLRTSGIRTGVVSNQSGVARGLISDAQVDAVNREVERQLGPLGPWFVCPHAPDAGCDCRKPAAGLVEAALARLAADRRRTVLVGDTAADMEAARRAGVRAVLVPNRDTLPAEVAAAPEVASDLNGAVDLILGAA